MRVCVCVIAGVHFTIHCPHKGVAEIVLDVHPCGRQPGCYGDRDHLEV
jgi:hypothetical protein